MNDENEIISVRCYSCRVLNRVDVARARAAGFAVCGKCRIHLLRPGSLAAAVLDAMPASSIPSAVGAFTRTAALEHPDQWRRA